jgi:MFS transporter, DHA1 family, multidrug resistance protein
MNTSFVRSAVILGLLSCVGPFAIDMYLPALPAVATDLNASIASVQVTLIAFFVAFGVSQLVYGPAADWYGRKPPLFVGLAIFIIGSLACAFAPSIGWLTAARFVQGLGAAAVMVIPRAIIRDMHTGTEATRLMALVMLVISVSPMLAPLAGSGLIKVWDWRSIFLVLVIAAVASIMLTAFMQPETLKREDRVPIEPGTLYNDARTLLSDPYFMGLTFIGGFGMASFFVFISSASFVYTSQYGLTPTGFSIAFAINAIGFFGASQMAAGLGEKLGMARVVSLATAGFLFFTVVLFVLTFAGFGTLPVVVGLLLCANACLGLVIPPVMVMALDPHGDIAGLASSLGGTLQMLAGGIMIALVAPFFDGTALPMVTAIMLCALCAYGISRVILPREQLARQASE